AFRPHTRQPSPHRSRADLRHALMQALAYIPFIDPLNIFQIYWYLLIIPLALGISITYKAMRIYDLGDYFRQVMIMTFQIILAMMLLAVGLTLLIQFVIPMLPVE
ncbi:MAG TPA: hypothetical protein VG711_08665, partial [Phycisphaerales bacterium]|nr:hypothetical protein [Phycisphaerales bacterium]